MASALTLLMLAIQLLTVVANTPTLPQSFRDTAVKIANQAITEANLELSTQATSTPPAVVDIIQATSQPTFGAIPQTMPEPTPTPAPAPQPTPPAPDLSGITVESKQVKPPSQENPYGIYFLTVSVLDKDGNTTPIPSGDPAFQPISMTVDGITDNRKIDGRDHVGAPWNHVFAYTPTSTADKVFTFTSGNLTKQFTLTIPAQ